MASTGTAVVNFDSTDQELLLGDLELFERVRAAGGIAWSQRQGGLWIVADYALCRRIACDDKQFISGQGIRFPPPGNPRIFALEYDRPHHTHHRHVLTALVGPRVVPALAPMVREHARRLLAAADPDGRIDLGTEYAYPFSLDVIFTLIGAPDELKAEMETLSESLFLYRRPMPDGSDPSRRLAQILDELIAERTTHPDDPWISRITRAGEAEGISDAEVRGALAASSRSGLSLHCVPPI
ncbi:hypothetical protein [Mycobacterium colombiense]|uniref:hypothetical protein n=1 Tax=Mycobacterium colombiense TaxID=339268 RepID=UPI00200B8605|nr:hypothetical protein [Mycobacterium colombiense]MCK8647138.1 hypothetical protein [Mycobacterium colombiense]